MKLVLTGFSQDVAIENKGVSNYLVFVDEESGTPFRLPVPQETISELVEALESAPEPEQEGEQEEEPETPPIPPPRKRHDPPPKGPHMRVRNSAPTSDDKVPPL